MTARELSPAEGVALFAAIVAEDMDARLALTHGLTPEAERAAVTVCAGMREACRAAGVDADLAAVVRDMLRKMPLLGYPPV